MFLTCVACCRNQRPSACAGLNQSYSWPSLVHTCFMLPMEAARTKVGFFVAAEAPDGFDAVVLGEGLGQFRGTACDEIHHAAGQVAGVET